MSYLYHERGHGLKTKRGKNDQLFNISPEKSPWAPVIEWQKAHLNSFPTLAKFNAWWKEVFSQHEASPEAFLAYLESLCDSCLEEFNQCKCQPQEPSFHEMVNNYEAFLNSRKSEFPK